MSLITPCGQFIRLAHLALITCHKVVFSSHELSMSLLTINGKFKDFADFLPPQTFKTIESGINIRKWVHNANRSLSNLITEELGGENEWLNNAELLQ